MTLQASFRAYVESLTAIKALIGERLYPVRGPDATPEQPPSAYVVYRFIDRTDEPVLLGPSPMAHVRLQLDCHSPAYDHAWVISEAFHGSGVPNSSTMALAFFQGIMGGGVYVTGCAFESARDEDDSRLGLFNVISEYLIDWSPI